MGIILPAICRDVIDGEYTEKVVKMLLPIFVIIAAWSPSVASFEPRLEEFANKYFTSTVLCNACCAVSETSEKIGLAGIVTKKKSIAGCEMKAINREGCVENCEKAACIYLMEYDFAFEPGNRNTKISCDRKCVEV